MNPSRPPLLWALRREPWRLLFPLGVVLGFWGTVPWLGLATGTSEAYRGGFHAIVQFQGLLTCFATGFLFTFVPRRTATAPPSVLELGIAALAPVAIAATAWFGLLSASTLVWLGLVATVLFFVAIRLHRADEAHAAPAPFVWLLAGLLSAFGGTVMLVLGGMGVGDGFVMHGLGMTLVSQGLFLPLVLGVGQAVLPSFLLARPPVKHRILSSDGALQASFAFLLLASFVIEWLGRPQLGWGVRAVVCFGVLMGMGGLWRRPTTPGLHHTFTWLSLWSLPVGSALAALWPAQRVAAAHVVYLGLGLMVLSFATHLVLSHSRATHGPSLPRAPVAAFGGLTLLALFARVAVAVDPARFLFWLGTAAAAFIAAGVVWLVWLAPRLWPRTPQQPPGGLPVTMTRRGPGPGPGDGAGGTRLPVLPQR